MEFKDLISSSSRTSEDGGRVSDPRSLTWVGLSGGLMSLLASAPRLVSARQVGASLPLGSLVKA